MKQKGKAPPKNGCQTGKNEYEATARLLEETLCAVQSSKQKDMFQEEFKKSEITKEET